MKLNQYISIQRIRIRSYKTSRKKSENRFTSLKNNEYFSEEDYKRIYPKSPSFGLFYGRAKHHKLKENDAVENLSLTPIISNVGKATYKTCDILDYFPGTISIIRTQYQKQLRFC